jgi:DNA-binding NarL/FixJ family response regulator
MKVFIVEDSVIIRGRIILNLTSMSGVWVCGVSGIATEAIELIEKEKPDIAIIDIRIIGGSGLEVLQKAKEANPSLIAIILTNYPFSEYKEKCLELGADFFFDKSTEFDKAFEVIERLVCVGGNLKAMNM